MLFRVRQKQEPEPEPAAGGRGPALGPVDIAIGAGLFALTLGAVAPIAYHFHREAMELDVAREEATARCRSLQAALEHVEAQKAHLGTLRRAVDRYAADVEARPIVPWTTLMRELSRRRPRGVWTTRLQGEGPRFTARVTAQSPDLVFRYAEQLRDSPYMEFAALPIGEGASTHAKLIGRAQGE